MLLGHLAIKDPIFKLKCNGVFFQIAELMKRMKELHAHKMRQNRVQMRLRAAQHEKEQAKIEAKRELKHKEIKKQVYRALGKAEKRKKGNYD